MRLNNSRYLLGIIITIVLIFNQSCVKINYSFSGANISGETISIDYFQNKAPIVQASLSQTLTEAMRDKFTRQSKLELIGSKDADLHLEGEITGYSVQPVAIQSTETAAKSRLTIVINVRFTNKTKTQDNFEQSFTAFYDFDATETLSQVETSLIDEIVKRLVEDVFNKAVVNW